VPAGIARAASKASSASASRSRSVLVGVATMGYGFARRGTIPKQACPGRQHAETGKNGKRS
jgi:hypothetical protein